MRKARDATLSMPRLILPSIQVNRRGGHLLAGLTGGLLIVLVAAIMLWKSAAAL